MLSTTNIFFITAYLKDSIQTSELILKVPLSKNCMLKQEWQSQEQSAAIMLWATGNVKDLTEFSVICFGPSKTIDWKGHVSPLVFAYNSTRHESTDQSPYMLMVGCNPRLPIDVAFGLREYLQKITTQYESRN